MSRAAAFVGCVLLSGCLAPVDVPATAAASVAGYLDATAVQTLGAAFTPTAVNADSERAIFDSVEPGTDRWWLAIAHAELRPPEAAQHFDCILGTRLTHKPRPGLTRLMNRLLIDSASVANTLAQREPRRRPIADRQGLEPCVRTDEAVRYSPSWPAGGAVAGAAYGEMFAALAPDRAAAARARGKDIGFSRALCRVNWHADVTDGVRIGRAVYERAAVTPGFAADLEAARDEVAAARSEGLTNPACAAERQALHQAGDQAGDQAGRGATSDP